MTKKPTDTIGDIYKLKVSFIKYDDVWTHIKYFETFEDANIGFKEYKNEYFIYKYKIKKLSPIANKRLKRRINNLLKKGDNND